MESFHENKLKEKIKICYFVGSMIVKCLRKKRKLESFLKSKSTKTLDRHTFKNFCDVNVLDLR